MRISLNPDRLRIGPQGILWKEGTTQSQPAPRPLSLEWSFHPPCQIMLNLLPVLLGYYWPTDSSARSAGFCANLESTLPV